MKAGGAKSWLRFLRIFFVGVGLILILVVVVAVAVLAPYYFKVQHFAADPSAGYHADFYLYSSPKAVRLASEGREVVMLVQPNNSGTNSDDSAVHRKDAWWTGFGRKSVADRLGVILLVPAFVRPGKDWHIYTHALDRDTLTTERVDLRRLDLQLLAMIRRARDELAEQGIKTKEKVLIQGYSASGMFANRFAVLHPERVLAVAAGSPGGWPIAPVAEFAGEALPYPVGVADLKELAGKSFDADAYRMIPQLIVLGSQDDNDSVDFRDGWDEVPARQIDRLFGEDPLSRWEDAEALYNKSGANATFLLIDGVGHDRRKLQIHSTDFFARVLREMEQ